MNYVLSVVVVIEVGNGLEIIGHTSLRLVDEGITIVLGSFEKQVDSFSHR